MAAANRCFRALISDVRSALLNSSQTCEIRALFLGRNLWVGALPTDSDDERSLLPPPRFLGAPPLWMWLLAARIF